MSVQYIENNGKREFAILPIDEYEKLIDLAEMAEDVLAYDKAKAGNDERIPSEIVERILSGENKLKVWREFRLLTQADLAERCEIAQSTIAQMEGGKRGGTISVYKKLAETLGLDVDDLI
ncbi:helix-turn-helix transcriptional regulator [Methylomonas sp. AM2-LC]|uniref:helix-turn-helix transcriptional regulator n=1 Tax=Methylomonas sp. AM2-LC TaxID=3153301 RepID=UPI0032643487